MDSSNCSVTTFTSCQHPYKDCVRAGCVYDTKQNTCCSIKYYVDSKCVTIKNDPCYIVSPKSYVI